MLALKIICSDLMETFSAYAASGGNDFICAFVMRSTVCRSALAVYMFCDVWLSLSGCLSVRRLFPFVSELVIFS